MTTLSSFGALTSHYRPSTTDANQVFLVGIIVCGRKQIFDWLDQINHKSISIDGTERLTLTASGTTGLRA